MPRFTEALSKPVANIKRRPPPPLGHYVMMVSKMPNPPEEFASKTTGITYEKLTFPIVLVAPSDDVDQDEIAEYNAEWKSVQGVPVRLDFIFDTEDDGKFNDTLARVKEFMSKLGLDTASGQLNERLAETVNCQFIGEIKHRPDPQNPEVLYAEIGSTTSL